MSLSSSAEVKSYEACRGCVEELALYLKPLSAAKGARAPVHTKAARCKSAAKKCPLSQLGTQVWRARVRACSVGPCSASW